MNGDMKLNPAKFASVAESTGTVPSSVPAPAASLVTAVAPSPSAGSIEVHSSPDSAEVYADDSFVGNTPATLKLSPGQHTIRVTLNGYKEWKREFMVQAGSDAHLAANLEKTSSPNAELAHGTDAPPTSNIPPITTVRNESPVTTVSLTSTQNSPGCIGVDVQNGPNGALVTSVTADGPGAEAGIKVGDVIQALDGRLVKDKNFENVVASLKPGTKITINYTRGAMAQETLLIVGKRTM